MDLTCSSVEDKEFTILDFSNNNNTTNNNNTKAP